jgi:hypothetical protein
MTPGHQAQPAILDPSPPMTEGVQLLGEEAVNNVVHLP